MSSQDIQHEIERTRDEMASTLEAIERRLSPRQLMDQAVDTMRDIASDNRVSQVVRDNPVPLALIGLGIGWLVISNMRGSGLGIGGAAQAGSALEGGASGEGLGYGAEYGPGYSGYAGYGGEGATGYAGTGGDGGGIGERASQAADQARSTLSRATRQTREKVDQWSRQARGSVGQATQSSWQAFQEHPITMGAVAALLGAAIGAMIPRSRVEEEALGDTAERLMSSARETGSDLVERAGRVAGRAAETLRQEGQGVAQSVKDAVKDEAGRQGLSPSEGNPSVH